MIRALVTRIFADELDTLLDSYEGSPYFWQERVHSMLNSGESDWFDDINTPQTEGRDDLIRGAALDAWRRLEACLGGNPPDWRWGDISRLRISSPIPAGKPVREPFPSAAAISRASGRRRTLWGSYGSPSYGAWAIDSLRFVADLGDPDKVLAVIPGGVSGRLFDPAPEQPTTAMAVRRNQLLVVLRRGHQRQCAQGNHAGAVKLTGGDPEC